MIETLDTMDAQPRTAPRWLGERAVTTADAAPLDGLTAWAAGQSAGLRALASDVPEAAQSALDDSLALLADVSGRVTGLESAVDCASGPATDGSDRLGPVPGTCAAGSTTPPAGSGTPGSTGGPGTTESTPGASSPSGTPDRPGTVTGSPGAGTPGGGTPGSGTPGNDPTAGLPGQGHPLPSLPTPSVGLPSLPVPSLSVPPLPGVSSLPTGSTGTAGTTVPSVPSVPTPSVGVDVCLGPITIGSC